MDVIQINSGEYVGIRVIAIKSIPHISTLSESLRPPEHIEHYAQDMANLLSEIYQQYKELYLHTGQNHDISIELSWITESIDNQLHNANIHLYILLRSIHSIKQRVEEILQILSGLLKATLDGGKYEYEDCSFTDFYSMFSCASNGVCQAIVKEERIEDLQNSYMPACYAYDKLPTDYQDLSRLASVLS